MKDAVKPAEFERKSSDSAVCQFYEDYWNDAEQRNYTIHVCAHPGNRGERSSIAVISELHDDNEYSCWHKNPKMPYRCWGEGEKIAKCPMALTETRPEVECSMFVSEEAHPTKARVTKEEIREKFYQPIGICMSCQNCIEKKVLKEKRTA